MVLAMRAGEGGGAGTEVTHPRGLCFPLPGRTPICFGVRNGGCISKMTGKWWPKISDVVVDAVVGAVVDGKLIGVDIFLYALEPDRCPFIVFRIFRFFLLWYHYTSDSLFWRELYPP